LEEFLKPLEISQNKLAMDIHVPATRIGEIVHWAPRHHSRDFSPSGSLFRYKPWVLVESAAEFRPDEGQDRARGKDCTRGSGLRRL